LNLALKFCPQKESIISMSRREASGRTTLSIATGAGIAFLAAIGAAQAGGGFSAPTYSDSGGSTAQQKGEGATGSSSTGRTVYSSENVGYSSTVNADANAEVTAGGVSAGVTVGTNANADLYGAGTVDQTSQSKATVFTKNGGVLAKGRAETTTTVSAGGQEVVVVEEVARAAARSTPYGSSSATSVEQNVYDNGGGYAGGNITTDKTVRTK
jgi:hypothetical protein